MVIATSRCFSCSRLEINWNICCSDANGLFFQGGSCDSAACESPSNSANGHAWWRILDARQRRPRLFFAAFMLHRFPAWTSHLDDGSRVPAAEGSRQCYLFIKRKDWCPRAREGRSEHETSKGRIRLYQRSPRYNQSGFPSGPHLSIVG